MTQQLIAAEPVTKHPDETLIPGVDFTAFGLSASETLIGTPTITPPSGITTSSPAVNVATFSNRKGGTVAIGKGVVFTVTGGTADTDYNIKVQCVTSAGQTLVGVCPVLVRDE
jgi:hypothetical protein